MPIIWPSGYLANWIYDSESSWYGCLKKEYKICGNMVKKLNWTDLNVKNESKNTVPAYFLLYTFYCVRDKEQLIYFSPIRMLYLQNKKICKWKKIFDIFSVNLVTNPWIVFSLHYQSKQRLEKVGMKHKKRKFWTFTSLCI